MVLRVVNVTPPAVGTDWSFRVPGQWLPYLYGVTATLTTAAALTTIPDESGNGRTGTIQKFTDYLIGQTGPFTGGADNVSVFGPQSQPGTPNVGYCESAVLAALGTANFTVETWFMQPFPAVFIRNGIIGIFVSAGAGSQCGVSVPIAVTDPYDVSVDFTNAARFNFGTSPSCNAWHHLAVSWDGVNWNEYVDGVNVHTHAGTAPPAAAPCALTCGGNHSFGDLRGWAAGGAKYGTALAGANIANHAAAKSNWAAYKAAVLVDAPQVFYRIGQLPAGPSRIATLKITDGTRVVAQFPASFAAATSDSFIWSWQVLGPGAQSSTDGKINSVPIPELAVDAGYVISTTTLDLLGTDQWGPITLWFDDGTGPSGGAPGAGFDAGYLNALLVPDYSHRSL